MNKIQVPRCLQPSPTTHRELHHFADASEVAYGVVSYLRIVTTDGRIECTIVMAKSRLAPIKRLTIPRLELQAATLAARQNALLRKELGLNLGSSTFWTDSTIVLQYIDNTEARYHTFVANRVAEIQETTNAEEWRHVPTRENPADDASRGVPVSSLMESRWLHGPEFLADSHRKGGLRHPPFDLLVKMTQKSKKLSRSLRKLSLLKALSTNLSLGYQIGYN